ncbi:MAG: dienelactone hydrolase family protein [Anaerolineae bacterium]|nr:dienelactone hydrolase family protein [Anaerolineae bacterium]
MATVSLNFPGGELSTYVATPDGAGPWPGVCVIHDALGMSQDLRNQADWLAGEGYLAAAPDLFDGGTFLGCVRTIMRDFSRGEGPLFDRVEAVRQWLIHHENSTGKVGVIGFCFGGGFALLLAPRGEFSAASVNYGALPKNADEFLKQACPIVASYGAKDRTLKDAADRLEDILTAAGIDHDVEEYPEADHAFMNDHSADKIPFLIQVVSFLFGGGEFNPSAAQDSRRRIIAFFDRHLKARETAG